MDSEGVWVDGAVRLCPKCQTEITDESLRNLYDDPDSLIGFSHRGIAVFAYSCHQCGLELSITTRSRTKDLSWKADGL